MASLFFCPILLVDNLTDEKQELVENEAETLYGLIHARFIITSRGLQVMVRHSVQHTTSRRIFSLMMSWQCGDAQASNVVAQFMEMRVL